MMIVTSLHVDWHFGCSPAPLTCPAPSQCAAAIPDASHAPFMCPSPSHDLTHATWPPLMHPNTFDAPHPFSRCCCHPRCVLVSCYAPCQGYPSPEFGSGQTRSSDGHGFSEQVAAPTRLSRPGFQSQTEGSLRGAMARRAERREATSAEWAVFHGDDI